AETTNATGQMIKAGQQFSPQAGAPAFAWRILQKTIDRWLQQVLRFPDTQTAGGRRYQYQKLPGCERRPAWPSGNAHPEKRNYPRSQRPATAAPQPIFQPAVPGLAS